MRIPRVFAPVFLFVALSTGSASGQLQAKQQTKLGENAALRYWSAFAEMQDASITSQQAQDLNLILNGKAPYEDLKYKNLVEKNKPALDTMIRGTMLPDCDWGIDYQLGSDTPVEYVRKALTLGRLNVLYVFHLLMNGDKSGAVRSLVAGLRFSHDVANGGTLFATEVAASLINSHLRVVEFALHVGGLSAEQRLALQGAVAGFGTNGLNWRSAIKRELDLYSSPDHHLDPQSLAAMSRITSLYMDIVSDPSVLPRLQQIIAKAPQQVQEIMPNPQGVLESEQMLTQKIAEARSMLE
jgi:hypothetical protein